LYIEEAALHCKHPYPLHQHALARTPSPDFFGLPPLNQGLRPSGDTFHGRWSTSRRAKRQNSTMLRNSAVSLTT
jgi:hypothetical protein